MATYKNGIITKNKIYQTCKELFYLHGYKNTTYKDICNHADVSPITITHFFQSKKIIAIEIHSDYLIMIKEKTKEYLLNHYDEYNLKIATVIEQIIFTKLIGIDMNYRKFYYDICVDNVLLESYIDKMDWFYKLHSDEYGLHLDMMHLRLLQITSTSISQGVTRKWMEGFLEGFTEEEYTKFRVKIMYGMMGISEAEVENLIKEAYTIFNKMTIIPEKYFSIEIC